MFTCGEMPYGRAKNPEVVERVQRGQILSQPGNCPNKVYEVSRGKGRGERREGKEKRKKRQ